MYVCMYMCVFEFFNGKVKKNPKICTVKADEKDQKSELKFDAE